MNTQVNQDDINKAAWKVCDAFRGTVAPDTYKDYVLTMLFVKYMSDVWQDAYDGYKREHGDHPELIAAMMDNERFKLPDGCSYYHLYKKRHEAGLGERIDKALHAIEDANLAKLGNVFQDISFNANKLGEEAQKQDILRLMLEAFHKPELDLRPSRIGGLDVIGDTYEYLIDRFAASAGKKAGEFFTPPAVSRLMANLMAPQEGDEICDPTCGSASLLMKCGRIVQDRHGSKRYALFGQEAIGSTWALAKMNMFLHGEDNHRIEWGDTIRNPKLLDGQDKLQHFDVVVANPPFSLSDWGYAAAEANTFGRFRRGLPPKTKGDYAFILHMVETMKPGSGRMAVVVPHGVLFRASTEGVIRKQLIKENLLDAVIGLPEKLFYGTGIPAAILVFRKNKADKNVLFIDASRDYRDGKNRNFLDQKHLDKILAAYAAREDVDKYSHLAPLEEIKENDFNLNIPRYVDTFEEEEEIDLATVLEERKGLKAELANLEVEMDGYLKELGYGA